MMNAQRPYPSVESLAAALTGRHAGSLFAADVAARRTEILDRVQGRRVLVVGGAGSIGAATVKELLGFGPATLCVVDQSENNLAELVRDVRGGAPLRDVDLRLLPIDVGSPLMRQFLEAEPPFDLVLNFAALKHVRSEKDRISLLQMLDTNLLKARRLLGWLRELRFEGRYFCVSTDKAANPVNLMGASKRLMELLVFSGLAFPELAARSTSARFANVAFSDGSLLAGYLRRMEKGQPLTAPRETRRYFISPKESGEICLLAATVAPGGDLLIPRLDAEVDLILLQDVAATVVRSFGFEPRLYQEEPEAKAACAGDIAKGRYPILLTPLDTSGEKPFEEFVGRDETAREIGLAQLLAVHQQAGNGADLAIFLAEVEEAVQGCRPGLGKEEIIRRIHDLIPHFSHVETGKHLDQRM
jgi:FlaA1/EpsC-like NDP-sugar epimerase